MNNRRNNIGSVILCSPFSMLYFNLNTGPNVALLCSRNIRIDKFCVQNIFGKIMATILGMLLEFITTAES
jgi:hypothetical protein